MLHRCPVAGFVPYQAFTGCVAMLLWVVSVKLVVEIALLALLGRWVLKAWLGRLAANRGHDNAFLWVLEVLARPALLLARWLTPRRIPEQALPVAAFALLAGLWVAATLWKISLCLEAGMTACR